MNNIGLSGGRLPGGLPAYLYPPGRQPVGIFIPVFLSEYQYGNDQGKGCENGFDDVESTVDRAGGPVRNFSQSMLICKTGI
jgi:hypothetical protein